MVKNLSVLVEEANRRISPYIRETPLEHSNGLSDLLDCNVFLKTENYQVTGSFKARGALNKILQLAEQDKNRLVVAASTGNHAAAVGFALKQVGMKGVIYLPENVSKTKVEKLKYYKNATLKYFANDSVATEREAKRWAAENGAIYVSPYNDYEIVAGQGTIGLEILNQMGDNVPLTIMVPVGGGGLISGIAAYLKEMSPGTMVVGCQPENSAVMHASVLKGEIIDMPSKPTISDGTAGGVEHNAITYSYCSELVDEWIEVSEDELMHAMGMIILKHNMIIEGAAGLSLASLIKKKERYKGQNVVLILCGNKISRELLLKILHLHNHQQYN